MDPTVYQIIVLFFILIGLVGIGTIIILLLSVLRALATFMQHYEEDRRYIGGIYQQVVESNEMLASAENNSFILASKAVETEE